MKETMLTNILEEEKILKNIISNFETKNQGEGENDEDF